MAIPAGHAVGESSTGKTPLPPFACLKTHVPLLLQQAGQRGELIHVLIEPLPACHKGWILDASPFPALRQGWIVAGDEVLVRILAGDDGGQARAAKTGGT